MNRLIATLHLWGMDLHATGTQRADRHTRRRDQRDRGSVTIENVLWAVAVIAIVAIVVVAIKGYVRTQAGKIR